MPETFLIGTASPKIESPIRKYDPPLSRWLKAYCLGHFLLLLCVFLHFEYDRDHLGYMDFSLKIAFFLCTSTAFLSIVPRIQFVPQIQCNPSVPFSTKGQIPGYIWPPFLANSPFQALCAFSGNIPLLWRSRLLCHSDAHRARGRAAQSDVHDRSLRLFSFPLGRNSVEGQGLSDEGGGTGPNDQ